MNGSEGFWTSLSHFKRDSMQDSDESAERLHKALDAFRAMPREEQLKYQVELDTVLSELTSLRTLVRSIIAMN
jgi:hypothetical protein